VKYLFGYILAGIIIAWTCDVHPGFFNHLVFWVGLIVVAETAAGAAKRVTRREIARDLRAQGHLAVASRIDGLETP
jgi:hypothetical protein